MFIAHFGVLDSDEENFLKNLLPNEQNIFFTYHNIIEHIEKIKDVEILSVFINSEVSKEILDLLPNLKLIVTRSTGFDHIDTITCKQKNILVANVPFYGENTVAEYSFALMLNVARKLKLQLDRTQNDDFNYQDLQGIDLEKKVFGVIGAGRIGLHAIRIARGFGMEVIVYDVFQNQFLAETMDFKYVDLDTLLTKSNIISLYAPLTPETKHILNKDSFAKIQKGTILVNTSRGGLIDTVALVEALENGTISGCGLDVLEEEKAIFGGNQSEVVTKLLNHQNVYYTAHTSYYTKEAVQRILSTSAQNILDFMAGKSTNLV